MNDSITSDLIRGHIDTIILKSLFEGDKYGYDIIKEIESRTGGEYKLKQPTLYSCLKRLEEQGFLRSYWGAKALNSGRKKYYSLSVMGRELFVQNQNSWQKSRMIIDRLVFANGEACDYPEYLTAEQTAVDYDKGAALFDANAANSHDAKSDTMSDNTGLGEASGNHTGFLAASYSQNETQTKTDVDDCIDISALTPTADSADGIESGFMFSDSVYFDQKSQNSYVDNVASTVYQPKKTSTSQQKQDYLASFDDELPFEQHAKKEYGEESDCLDVSELEPIPPSEYVTTKPAPKFDARPAPAYTPPSSVASQPAVAEFIKYDTSVGSMSDAQIIERDYQGALAKLVRASRTRYSDDPYLQSKLERTAVATQQMGDEVVIRRHTDTIKEFNSENYIYSGKLKLFQYFFIFCVMLFQTIVMFSISEIGVHDSLVNNTDLWIYIFGVLVALALPAIAFGLSVANYNRRKKNEFDFKSTLVFRLILCALAWVVLFAIAGYRGIFTNSFDRYLATFLYPAVLSTCLVLDVFVYNHLLKTKRFNC